MSTVYLWQCISPQPGEYIRCHGIMWAFIVHESTMSVYNPPLMGLYATEWRLGKKYIYVGLLGEQAWWGNNDKCLEHTIYMVKLYNNILHYYYYYNYISSCTVFLKTLLVILRFQFLCNQVCNIAIKYFLPQFRKEKNENKNWLLLTSILSGFGFVCI